MALWLVLIGLAFGPAIAAEPATPMPVIVMVDDIHNAVDRGLREIASVPAEELRLEADAAAAWSDGDILRAAIYCLVLLMIGGGSEWLFWCYAGKAWRGLAEAAVGRNALPPARAASLGLRRAAFSALGAAMFAGGVLVPAAVFSWSAGVRAGIVGVVAAITAIRAIALVSALALAPHAARLRLVAHSDRTARRLQRAVVALAAALAGGAALSALLRDGAQAPGLARIVAIACGGLAAGLALHAARLIPPPVSVGRAGAALRPIALTLAILLCLVLHLMGARAIVSTALLWAAAVLLGQAVWPVMAAYTAEAPRYRPVLKSAMRIVIFSGAAVATFSIWNISLLHLMQSPTMTGRMALHGFNLVVVILAADLVWVWARTFIDGMLANVAADSSIPGPGPNARLVTLLPLLRVAILVTLSGVAVLAGLSALGVDIAPLLAGAGVVGIALGLGAQTLVRDIVSGVFYLVADSFRVGEHVGFGEIRGTVEGISPRFLRIRHEGGAVYTVPFGEIKWLVNHSRDWAMTELELRVPFATDLALVRSIIDGIGAELMGDARFGIYMIEPLQLRGVARLEETSMVLSVRCTTRPDNGRFDIRHEANHRIRAAFDRHGIRFAHKAESSRAGGNATRSHEGLSPHEVAEIMHAAVGESPAVPLDEST